MKTKKTVSAQNNYLAKGKNNKNSKLYVQTIRKQSQTNKPYQIRAFCTSETNFF